MKRSPPRSTRTDTCFPYPDARPICFMSIQLKPQAERQASASDVVNRLRGRLQNTPGARVFLVPQQDIFLGGGQGSGSYDYTLLAGELSLLRTWMPKVQQAMAALPELTDVDTSVEDKGRQVELVIDREAATRLGISMSDISSVLNNSFSQRQVSVMYGPLNRSEEHTSELQSIMRISYAVFCFKKKQNTYTTFLYF